MAWNPDFKLGLWNAWILMFYYPLHPIIMILIDKILGTGEIFKKMADLPYRRSEKWAFNFAIVVSLVMFIYSLFLPLRLGTGWFYVGLLIYLIGLAMVLAAIVILAKTPLGYPFVSGIYRYSRHPMTFFSFITFLGISLAAASWVFLIPSIVVFALQAYQTPAEERGCLKLYGDRYREYLDRTPKWLGLPKSS
jgi:protein-S-isoprenylcysteine O-methyltransferase Ste14